jgi:ribonucleotide reductase alpha subunit
MANELESLEKEKDGLESLGILTFLRSYSKDGKENYAQTVERYLQFWRNRYPSLAGQINGYGQALHEKAVVPSMRMFQFAGEAVEKSEARAFNCCYLGIEDFKDFADMCYLLACGCGVGVSVQKEYVDAMPTVSEGHEDSFVVPDTKEGWADSFQMLCENPKLRFDYRLVRPAGAPISSGGTACLTGDTLLFKDRKKSRSQNTITVRDLYNLKNGDKGYTLKGVKIRSLDEDTGEFFRNSVVDVVTNGVAEVFIIKTLRGYAVKATGNHRFLTNSGEYKQVSEFRVGELIGVNGSVELKTGTCLDCGSPVSRRASRCLSCANNAQKKDDCSATTARARAENKALRKTYCEMCGESHDFNVTAGNPCLQNHHMDRNPHNNSKDNITTLCESCHHTLHAREDKFGDAYAHRYLDFDEIESIDSAGYEEVFDVSMAAPHHNFIANGFVSHNSGPHPLMEAHAKIRTILSTQVRKQLRPIDVADITCLIAQAIVAGASRRSAIIILFSSDDAEMLNYKQGNWWDENPQRMKANVSGVSVKGGYETDRAIQGLFTTAYGEPGVVLTEKTDTLANTGTNPCVSGDTTVLTPEGPKRIDSLVGVPTVIWNGFEWSDVVPEVTGHNQKMLKVAFSNGSVLRCTENHTFHLHGGSGGSEMKPAVELTPGDAIYKFYLPDDGENKVGRVSVVSVTADGVDPSVYCFNEPKRHTVIFNGVLTGNCGEISLRSREMCNLTEIISPNLRSESDFLFACRAAAFFGTLQASLTNFTYIKPEWKKNCDEDALLGVSITGCAQAPKFITKQLLREGALEVIKQNQTTAKKIGINTAKRLTCVKPSGSTSCVMGTTSGIHAAHGEYVIRRVRVTKLSPLAQSLIAKFGISDSENVVTEHGTFILPTDKYSFIVHEAYSDKDIVLQFPCHYQNAIYRKDESAVELLERMAEVYENWVKPGHIEGQETNNVSITVSYKPEEVGEVSQWMKDNQDKYRGISVLPDDCTAYPLLPFEEVSKEEWLKYYERFPVINWEVFGISSNASGSSACSGGGCEVNSL